MAFPFGPIQVGLLKQVLGDTFSIEERHTNGLVDTLDGPQNQPFWFNPNNQRFVEAPAQLTITVERLAQIARRLGLDQAEVYDALLSIQSSQ